MFQPLFQGKLFQGNSREAISIANHLIIEGIEFQHRPLSDGLHLLLVRLRDYDKCLELLDRYWSDNAITTNVANPPCAVSGDIRIYPQELYQLHTDLDSLAYGDLSQEESSRIFRRLPGSMEEAENRADRMLADHLQREISRVGYERYRRAVLDRANEDARVMYSLRCYIASSAITAEPDVIEVYPHVPLNNTMFHDPKDVVDTGEGPAIDETESEDPYSRALSKVDDRKPIERIVSGYRPSARDLLPESMRPRIENILASYGLKVDKDNAWKVLDDISRRSAVHDRIISRILYLMTNADMRSASDRLAGDNERMQ